MPNSSIPRNEDLDAGELRRGNVARATLHAMSTADCDAITTLALAAPDDDRLAGLSATQSAQRLSRQRFSAMAQSRPPARPASVRQLPGVKQTLGTPRGSGEEGPP